LALPDPRWLEILKASGWQTSAVAGACGIFLLLAHWLILPPLDPWMIQLAAIVGLICGLLALASFISAIFRFLPVQRWIVHGVNRHRAKRAVQDYIPHMTAQEKQIIAYLLAKNQKMFTAESDGGYAATLLSRGIVVVAVRPNQHVDMSAVPMAIPDHVWDVLVRHKDQFPYSPQKSQGHPWRVPWMAR
jgi:hypothetical protein